MRITLLGTGTPILEPNRQGSALLVEEGDVKLLFDAGRGVTTQLAKIGIEPQQIDLVFITHHHHDHVGNLGEFLLASWHNGRETQLNVYGPPGTTDIVAALLGQVYARDIVFALFTVKDMTDIRELVRVHDIAPGVVYEGDKWRVLAAYVDHGNGLGLSQEEWPCMGYHLEAEEKVVAISGDAVACDGLNSLARDADVLIQCCYLAEDEITNRAFRRLARHVIASSEQVGKIAAHNKVKKLVLTHIRPKPEAMMRALVRDVRNGYDGDILLGEDLMIVEI
jgi:ribonuclease BN (tRNA processing enzyme)